MGRSDPDPATPDSTPRPTTTTEPTTTTLSDGKIEAAKAGWLAYVAAASRASAAPVTPRLPEVQAAVTGNFQLEITTNLEVMQAPGEASGFNVGPVRRATPSGRRGVRHDLQDRP